MLPDDDIPALPNQPSASADTPGTPAGNPQPGSINVGDLTGAIGVAIGHGATAAVSINLPSPAQALHQIPDPPADFVGRETELNELIAAVGSGGALISGLQGMGGVGKTVLAYRVAKALREEYPDAQLVVELRGLSEQGQTPLTPAEAMAQVVRAWRPGEKLPETEGELHGLYQDALRGKRALLLLDNARDADQVAPLLPPAPCAVIITSRQRFTLPGMKRTDLEKLSGGEARTLLQTIVRGLPDAVADEIARLCAWLPLALRLAGSALAVRPDLTPAGYAARLAEAQKRLELIEASACLSYDLLTAEQQARWRALAMFPESFEVGAVATVWQVDVEVARDALGELLLLSLVEWDATTPRYRLHDLLRVFVDDRLVGEERERAGLRHAEYYQVVATLATDMFRQGNEKGDVGRYVFDQEWDNIKAGQAWAQSRAQADRSAARLTAAYALGTSNLLDLRLPAQERVEWLMAAVEGARRLADRDMEGAALGNLGLAYAALGQTRRAIDLHEQALQIHREIGNRVGEGINQGNLGIAYAALGEPRRAIEFLEHELEVEREFGDRQGEARALGNLGSAYATLGEIKRATEFYEQQLIIVREIGNWHEAEAVLTNLGSAYLYLGSSQRALDFFRQALDICRKIDDRQGEAMLLANMGTAHLDLGMAQQAIEYNQDANAIATEIGDIRVQGSALGNLANAYLRIGEYARAIEYYQQRLEISRVIEDRQAEAASLNGLGNTYVRLGEARRAIDLYQQTLEMFRAAEDRHGEGAVLGNLGSLYAELAETERAVACYQQALEISRTTGDAEVYAGASLNMALLLAQLGSAAEALPHAYRAFTIYESIDHTEYMGRARALMEQLSATRASGTVAASLAETISAIFSGDVPARAWLDQALDLLKSQGFQGIDAVRRIVAGERDVAALTAGLDESSRQFVQKLVEYLPPLTGTGAPTVPPHESQEPQPGVVSVGNVSDSPGVAVGAGAMSLVGDQNVVNSPISVTIIPPDAQEQDRQRRSRLHGMEPPPADFTGRQAELDELLAALRTGGAVITGMQGAGGIGKSALARRLAQELLPQYPDAQFDIDLKGVAEQGQDPLKPAAVMQQIIRAYHPTAQLPDDEGELRKLYLGVLHGQKVLLLLDNARDAGQVRPLMPPAGCALLVTSRQHLVLEGLRVKHLDVLPPDDARRLLQAITPRLQDAEAAELAEKCGRLPIALRLAGSQLVRRFDLTAAEYSQRLADRLEQLTLVEASISLSYDMLTREQQVWWCALAIFPGSFDWQAARAIWDIPWHEDIEENKEAAFSSAGELVRERLAQLVERSLVEWDAAQQRYRLHDLLRVFAEAQLLPVEREAAGLRYAAHYLALLTFAGDMYVEGDESSIVALRLFDLERQNVFAGQKFSGDLAAHHFALGLQMDYALGAAQLLNLRLNPRERIGWLQPALKAAQQLEIRQAEGAALANLGLAYASLGEVQSAVAFHTQALAVSREIGDRELEGATLGNLGNVSLVSGKFHEAIEHLNQQLEIVRGIGDERGEASALANLGSAYGALGDVKNAIWHLEQSLVVQMDLQDRRWEAATLGNLGNAYLTQGHAHRAIEYYQQALKIHRALEDRRGEGSTLGNLGNASILLGDDVKAIPYLEQALEIDRETEDSLGMCGWLGTLGKLYARSGQIRKALEYHAEQLKIAENIKVRHEEGAALSGMGEAYATLGDWRSATEYFERALLAYEESGDVLGRAATSYNFALVLSQSEHMSEALKHAEYAIVIFEQTGQSENAQRARELLQELRSGH
ncbi:MAG: tetratricopeptide repeat protein [Anaerolineales bacterium]|nr:tetratricopeptide repeat protein [Anaerolineales bacterium]